MHRALLSIAAAGCLALALALSGGAARAQGVAMGVDGWDRSVAPTGTVFYRCTAPASCGQGSVASYRQQPNGPLPSLAVFRAQNESINRRMVEGSGGRVLSVDLIEIAESEVARAKVQTAIKAINHSDGRREYLATSVFSDGERHYSLVSTAAGEPMARANLQAFLPVVMLAAQIGGKPAPAR
ncbi:MAG: hypothetical protein J0H01_20230 [Rhizobiales bacterium]|nr:hypothetical protein [Hyphomicrobiales bacterium]